MGKPSYLDTETMVNALKGISSALEINAAAIAKGKNLTMEDATALESYAVTLRSAAKTLLDLDAKLKMLKEIINK